MNESVGADEGGAARRERILAGLATAVDQMDEEGAVHFAREALQAGLDAYEAVTEGLSKGMVLVSEKYDKGIYFVPEILVCADAMYAAIEVLRPHLKVRDGAGARPASSASSRGTSTTSARTSWGSSWAATTTTSLTWG